VNELLDAAIEHIRRVDPWTHDEIDLRPVVDELGLKRNRHMKVLYAAITGRTAGLPLFESIEMLGRESALTRLKRAREKFSSG
jgi:glutamyl-tRNA synthetase